MSKKKVSVPRKRVGRQAKAESKAESKVGRDGRIRKMMNLDSDDRRRLETIRVERSYKDASDVLRAVVREQLALYDKLTKSEKENLVLPDTPKCGDYKPYQLWATEKECLEIQRLRLAYGLTTDVAAVRFAIREVADRMKK